MKEVESKESGEKKMVKAFAVYYLPHWPERLCMVLDQKLKSLKAVFLVCSGLKIKTIWEIFEAVDRVEDGGGGRRCRG